MNPSRNPEMTPTLLILFLSLSGHVMCQDPLTLITPSPAPAGLFSSLTGFLPSFPSLPTLPSLSVGPLPCVGLSTLSQGRCISSDACAGSGGSGDSGCLSNGQVCCIPSLKCGATVSGVDAWITNTEYPNVTVESQNCVYTINKASPVIAQLRVEVDTVSLSDASETGQCRDDKLMIEGVTGVNLFPLCGISKGSHMILPFTSSALTVRVVISGSSVFQRRWRLHLSQIPYNSISIAPAGCTQLYSSDGILTSINPGVPGLKYAVCFHKKPGTCGLRLDMSSLIGSQVSPLQVTSQINARLSKRQVDVSAANTLGVNVPSLPSNIFLPSIVKTNVETAQNGDQKATADLFNLQFLNNGIRIGKEVVVQNSLPSPPPSTPAPAPLPILVEKVVQQKPITPHYYGGRYYPHSLPAPAYSAPLPAPTYSAPPPAPVAQNTLVERPLVEKTQVVSEPVTPLLQSNLVLGAGVNGLLGVNNNLTATVGNPLLAPLPLLPSPVPVLPNLTLPSLLQPAGLPVVQTTLPGTVIAGKGVGVSTSVNAGIESNLGTTLTAGVRARRQDGQSLSSIQNPNICHLTMFAAPRSIVCLERYTGASEIVLSGSSPYEILYIEAATTLVPGSKWRIPFTFVTC